MPHRVKALQEALEEKLFPASLRAGKAEEVRKENTGWRDAGQHWCWSACPGGGRRSWNRRLKTTTCHECSSPIFCRLGTVRSVVTWPLFASPHLIPPCSVLYQAGWYLACACWNPQLQAEALIFLSFMGFMLKHGKTTVSWAASILAIISVPLSRCTSWGALWNAAGSWSSAWLDHNLVGGHQICYPACMTRFTLWMNDSWEQARVLDP